MDLGYQVKSCLSSHGVVPGSLWSLGLWLSTFSFLQATSSVYSVVGLCLLGGSGLLSSAVSWPQQHSLRGSEPLSAGFMVISSFRMLKIVQIDVCASKHLVVLFPMQVSHHYMSRLAILL